MKKITTTEKHYTPKQLKMPIEIARIIEISDPVYKFSEVMDSIDKKNILQSGNAEQVVKDIMRKFY